MASKIFNEVTLPENCAAVTADSASFPTNGLTKGDVFGLVGSRVFLYDSHYCSTDRTHDPTIAACASFGSGIRVYDIRDPRAPKEIAYFNPGTTDSPAGAIANATVGRPVIRSDLGQIWFADIAKGFHVVQFRDGIWPFAARTRARTCDPYLAQYDLNYGACRAQRRNVVRLPGTRACNTRRSIIVRLNRPPAGRVTRVVVRVKGKRVRVLKRAPKRFVVRGLPRTGRYRVRVTARTTTGARLDFRRRYRACVAKRGRPLSADASAVLYASGVDAAGLLYYCRTLAAT